MWLNRAVSETLSLWGLYVLWHSLLVKNRGSFLAMKICDQLKAKPSKNSFSEGFAVSTDADPSTGKKSLLSVFSLYNACSYLKGFYI